MPRRRFAAAPVRIEHEYKTPREYKVPIEPHGLIAQWEGDTLTIWEPSQWIDGMARTYAEWFGIPFEKVRLISPYIGGGFGSKGFAYAHGAIAAMAAKMLDRPVKLAVTRPQTFTAYRRPAGDAPDHRARRHEGGQAPRRSSIAASMRPRSTACRVEPLGSVTSIMYATPNFSLAPERRAGEHGDARRLARAGREPERLRHRMRDRRAGL